MSSIAVGLKRPYGVIQDGELQNKPVYSPIPKKYLQKGPIKTFGMVLRSRIPFKQLNGTNNVKAIAQKSTKESVLNKGSTKNGKSAIKRKVKQATKSVMETFPKRKKLETQFNKNNTKVCTPRTSYRNRLANSLITPNNPFADSPPQRRRSKRLSRIHSQDDFSSHLEHLSTGLKMLRTNSQNLQTAVEKLDKSPIPFSAKISPKQQGDSKYKQLDTDVKPFQRNILRKTMSRISVKSQNLSSKFAKSASSVQAWKNGYGEMASSPIRG